VNRSDARPCSRSGSTLRARGGDFSLPTSGDLSLATGEDSTWPRTGWVEPTRPLEGTGDNKLGVFHSRKDCIRIRRPDLLRPIDKTLFCSSSREWAGRTNSLLKTAPNSVGGPCAAATIWQTHRFKKRPGMAVPQRSPGWSGGGFLLVRTSAASNVSAAMA